LQRVQQEVRALAPDPAAYGFDQMEQLVYLEACASETMRLKPVAPFTRLSQPTVAFVRFRPFG
ncbi:MAG: cytochrome P450, partial [Rubrivivax sp.]